MKEIALNYFETGLVVVSCLFVLLANSAFESVHYSNIAISGILLTIILVFISKKELWWKTLMAIIFVMFIILILEIKKYSEGGKLTHRKMIFHAREEIFFEYVF